MKSHRTARGFTLLELLVVLVVIAIGTAMVSARLLPDDQRLLDQDAERLAQILSVAQEQSAVKAETMVFMVTDSGFQFAVMGSGNTLRPLRDDLLGPRKWQLPDTRIRIESNGLAIDRLPITPEPGLDRILIELSSKQAKCLIARRFSGRYLVVRR